MNAVNDWTARHLASLEGMIYAIEDLRSAAGNTADTLAATGDWGDTDGPLDDARQGVSNAAGAVAALPAPPNRAMADALAAFLDEIPRFTNPASFDDWRDTWVRAIQHWDHFIEAMAITTNQPVPTHDD